MLKTKEEIEEWLNHKNIKKYTINSNLTVDVEGDVVINQVEENILPIQFGIIKGNFSMNTGFISSLKGSPKEVYGNFNVAANKLTSLKYCPVIITGSLNISKNELTSLKGCPEEVEGFYCYNNKLTSLKHGPQKTTYYIATHNKLISLEGAPEIIIYDFNIAKNQLKSLKYGPKIIKGQFIASDNQLETLLGFPLEVGAVNIVENKFDISECINLNIKASISLSYHNKEKNELLESYCDDTLKGLELKIMYEELNQILFQEKLHKELPQHSMKNKAKL